MPQYAPFLLVRQHFTSHKLTDIPGAVRRELAQALTAVEDQRELILAQWERIHDRP